MIKRKSENECESFATCALGNSECRSGSDGTNHNSSGSIWPNSVLFARKDSQALWISYPPTCLQKLSHKRRPSIRPSCVSKTLIVVYFLAKVFAQFSFHWLRQFFRSLFRFIFRIPTSLITSQTVIMVLPFKDSHSNSAPSEEKHKFCAWTR